MALIWSVLAVKSITPIRLLNSLQKNKRFLASGSFLVQLRQKRLKKVIFLFEIFILKFILRRSLT